MKIRLVVFAFVLLFLMSASVFSQIAGGFEHIQLEDEKYYKSVISTEQLIETPSWKPEIDEAPPLSARDAVKAARKELKRLFPETAEETIVLAVLLRLTEEKDKWVYEIKFKFAKPNCFPCAIKDFSVFVLMNGKPVEMTLTTEKDMMRIPVIRQQKP